MKNWGRIFAGLFLLALLPYGILAAGVHTKKFKTFAEQQAGEYLKAGVRIGKIRPGFFSRIILSDFVILPGSVQKFPYRVVVDKLIFKYSLLQILTGRFTMPSSVLMKSPRLVMNGTSFPYAFFEDLSLQTGGQTKKGLSSLDLAGGEIRYEVPMLRTAVTLREIRGHFEPETDGKIKGALEAKLQGLAEGIFRLKGTVIPKTGERQVVLEILSGSVRQGILPMGNTIEVKARLVNQDLFIDSFILRAGRSSSFAAGKISNLGPQAVAEFQLEVKRLAQQYDCALKVDLAEKKFRGTLKSGETKPVLFDGRLDQKDSRYLIEDFKTNTELTGNAFWDTEAQTAGFSGAKGAHRASVEAALKQSPIQLRIDLEHFLVSGLDLVYKGNALLTAATSKAAHLPFAFEGNFATDLFVLEYLPLDDFQGRFDLNSEGFTAIDGTWGKEFKVSGDLRFAEQGLKSDLTVRVNEFQLKNVKKFASKPLPKELGGRVEGKVHLTGVLPKIQAEGAFTVADGLLGKVEYDQAIIQLSGMAPYFKLTESRIQKGRTTLRLNGGIDLSLANIFAGVEIQSPDNMIVWKGTEASLQEAEDGAEVEVDSTGLQLPSLKLTVGKGRKKSDGSGESTQTHEKYVQVGPKFKF